MTGGTLTHPTENFDEMFVGFIRAGELRIPHSADGEVMSLNSRNARNSWDTHVQWLPASGYATLYSFVIYHQQYDPARATPYNVATVELVEGPRLVSTVLIDDLSALRVGMPLRAEFSASGELVFIPED